MDPDLDILDLHIYFKDHLEKTSTLHLSPEEYNILYQRSHYLSSFEDIRLHTYDQPFVTPLYLRYSYTPADSPPPIFYQFLITTPDLFALDAVDVSYFLLI